MGALHGLIDMKVTKEIIERYHQGLCSLEEVYAVEQWLESDEFEMSFPEKSDLSVMENRGWKKISSRYHLAVRPKPTPSLRLRNRMIWQLVACVILVLGITTFYHLKKDEKIGSDKNRLVYKAVKTLKGQKLNVTLPDGTIVWLNSESVLRFPESFEGNRRELEFSGEGYFKVAKNPLKPFIIHTAKTKVQVLGTQFNLRALTMEKATSVVVEEGKVRFTGNSGKQELILTANRRGVFEAEGSPGAIMKAEDVYAGKYIAWKNNELQLDNLSMEQIVHTLESWYNVKIIISRDELRSQRYTGSFNNPALKPVLQSMGFAVKFSYKQHGKTFILY
jgi:transmembrane sensor